MQKFNEFIHQFIDLSDAEFSNIKRVGRNYFYADPELSKFSEGINRDLFSIGIFFGEEKRDFVPSPACIEWLSRFPESANRKVFVNKKAEWLFICGRNILKESVLKNPGNTLSGYVFVQNEQDENLGYGIFKQEGKDLIIRNLLDKGKYLRYNERGRKEKK